MGGGAPAVTEPVCYLDLSVAFLSQVLEEFSCISVSILRVDQIPTGKDFVLP